MLVFIEAEERKRGFRAKWRLDDICAAGMRAAKLTLSVPNRARERSVDRASEGAVRAIEGIYGASVIFRDDFPFREKFAACGLSERGETELYSAKAADIILAASEGRERLYLCFSELTSELCDNILRLSGKFRHIEADCPERELERLSAVLMQNGLAVTAGRPGKSGADGAIILSKPKRVCYFSPRCAVLPIAGDRGFFGGRRIESAEFSFPESFLRDAPEGYSANKIAAYALFAGVLKRAQVSVARVKTEK